MYPSYYKLFLNDLLYVYSLFSKRLLAACWLDICFNIPAEIWQVDTSLDYEKINDQIQSNSLKKEKQLFNVVLLFYISTAICSVNPYSRSTPTEHENKQQETCLEQS